MQLVTEGLLLAGAVAFVAAKVLHVIHFSAIRSAWIFAFTHTVPIVIAVLLLPLIGVGHWFKAAIVAAGSFLPLLQSLWHFGDQPLVGRMSLALDHALAVAESIVPTRIKRPAIFD
jgi:hypothetical protein